jgi:hypothetical protein
VTVTVWHPVDGLLQRKGRAPQGQTADVETFTAPLGSPVSPVFTVAVEGSETCCYSTDEGHYAKCAVGPGVAEVTVTTTGTVTTATVHPARHGITPEITGPGSLVFTIGRVGAYVVVINDDWTRPLYVFANPIDPDPPGPGDVTHYYAAGYYDHVRPDGTTPLNVNGALVLAAGQSCYVHGGAFLHGKISIGTDQSNVGPVNAAATLRGHGCIDSTQTSTGNGPGRPTQVGNMNGATMQGVTFVGQTHWACPIFESVDVDLDHVQIINLAVAGSDTPDGIDIVGSSRVAIDGCFIRANDDAIAVKTFKQGFGPSPYWRGNVEDITVTDTVIHQGDGGNGCEVGYENLDNNSSSAVVNDPVTGAEIAYVRDIAYTDVDIVRKERDPAINYRMAGIGIHLVDGVPLSNVTYRRVNLEYVDGEFWLWLGSFFTSDYSYGDERAQISDVLFEDVNISGPASLPIHVQGGGGGKTVSGLSFVRTRVNGHLLTDTSTIPGAVTWEVTNTDPITFG